MNLEAPKAKVIWHKYRCTAQIPIYLGYPHLNMTKVEKNRRIQTDIMKLINEKTWIIPQKGPLGKKLATKRPPFYPHIT